MRINKYIFKDNFYDEKFLILHEFKYENILRLKKYIKQLIAIKIKFKINLIFLYALSLSRINKSIIKNILKICMMKFC